MMIDSQRTPVFRGLEEEENQVTNTEKEQRVQLKKKTQKTKVNVSSWNKSEESGSVINCVKYY